MRGLTALAADHSAREALERALEVTGYRRSLDDAGTDDAEARLENLEELAAVAQEVEDLTGDASLEAFLQHLALQTDADTLEERADRVTLMTLHSAKGLEFPVAVLAGLEEGLFPHVRSVEQDDSLAEERRLCYVGMTRAQTRLVLTHLRGSAPPMGRPGRACPRGSWRKFPRNCCPARRRPVPHGGLARRERPVPVLRPAIWSCTRRSGGGACWRSMGRGRG